MKNEQLCIFLAVVMLLLSTCHLFGQETESAWDELMQQMAEEENDAEDEAAWESQQEMLSELHEHPLDLNLATRRQLAALPFLSEAAADAILDYRARHGALRSLGELLFIGALSPQERRWLPLVAVAGEAVRARGGRQGGRGLRHELTTRIDVPLYERDGWPWRRGIAHRLRYTLQAGKHVDAGVRLSKGTGEPMFSRDNAFWDCYGGHVMLRDVGCLKSALVGDFKAGFGEGLVLNNGLRFGKMTTMSWRTAGGFRPHRSADEVYFLRGAAATLSLGGGVELTALYSYRQLDATVAADNSVATISTSGLHRTPSELQRKGALGSHTAALHATWQHATWHVGATAMYQRYDHQFRQPTASLYRQIYPEGYQFGAFSLDYACRFAHFLLKGETAHSRNRRGGGWATLNKASWRFSPNSQLTAIQRFYSKYYYSPHAMAFGENSNVQNESGVAVMWDADRLGAFAVRAFADVFYSPWPRYTMTRASWGWEALMQTTFQPRRGRSLLVQYRVKSKELSDERYVSHRLRATYAHAISSHWSGQATVLCTLRTQGGHASPTRDGIALAPRMDYTTTDARLRCALMAVFFRTDDFTSRLFLYEPSLFQTFGLQQLYGRGQRLAATVRLRSRDRRWAVQTKVGVTHYADRNEISEGPTRIGSPWKADVQVLLRTTF